ncbi:hypothetical protein CBR_g50314 [Chara braunii]|uniref:CBF1-interacting co-repressor CIR N-terminal domain-containing protein n=1 Tax=Chara braunii TaxID=69332 RepID=A0A388K5D5_CHABU|nr:hypothetical protein CBR_g50314 [Chara braunii]|eukprot:GBG65272.1 hypothetical protein CBR_g50314 [Chara braunii]
MAPLGVGKEVEFKQKSGTAWSHAFLNQKSWHPLSYPNQKRLWIAQQVHAVDLKKKEEVAREFAQEQEFFRQTAVLSGKEKKKLEDLQAVGFLYARPPGYNAESAHAAKVEEERKKEMKEMLAVKGIEQCSGKVGEADSKGANLLDGGKEEKDGAMEKKPRRVRDVFGRTIPTEEEFSVLKGAPRMETGVTGRAKPFAIEVRNVKCARCGSYGHQSGDRECSLRGMMGPSEIARQAREDPLTLMQAQIELEEPTAKWELKQRPGACSPTRGGFKPDDPNQQFVPPDVFDEYGGFLSDGAQDDENGFRLGLPGSVVMASVLQTQREEMKHDMKAERRKERRERKRRKHEERKARAEKKRRKQERKRKREEEEEKEVYSKETAKRCRVERQDNRCEVDRARAGREAGPLAHSDETDCRSVSSDTSETDEDSTSIDGRKSKDRCKSNRKSERTTSRDHTHKKSSGRHNSRNEELADKKGDHGHKAHSHKDRKREKSCRGHRHKARRRSASSDDSTSDCSPALKDCRGNGEKPVVPGRGRMSSSSRDNGEELGLSDEDHKSHACHGGKERRGARGISRRDRCHESRR